MLKKFPSDKATVTKNALFFLSRAPTHHSFNFNLQFLYELKHMVYLSKKLFARFSIFDSVLFHFNFVFLFNKKHGLFWLSNVIIPFKVKILQKPQTVLVTDLWFLSCNKEFENSVISAWVGAPQKLTYRRIF